MKLTDGREKAEILPGSREIVENINPLSYNSDLNQISHCSIKGLSVTEVMSIKNMITQVKFS